MSEGESSTFKEALDEIPVFNITFSSVFTASSTTLKLSTILLKLSLEFLTSQ